MYVYKKKKFCLFWDGLLEGWNGASVKDNVLNAYNYIVCCETRMFCLQSSSLYVVYLHGYNVCLYAAIGELCYSVKGVPMFLVFVCQNTRHAMKSSRWSSKISIVRLIASYFLLTWEPSKCWSTQAIGCTVGKPGP